MRCALPESADHPYETGFMRSISSPRSVRRQLRAAERRARRRPAIIAGGLGLALAVAAGAAVSIPSAQAAETQAAPASEGFLLASYSAPLEPLLDDTDKTTTQAREALDAAEAAVTAAAAIADDIDASGLVLTVPDTTVDTDELEAAVARLEDADLLPAPLVAAFTKDVRSEVIEVKLDVSGLRGSLDAAIAVKAAEEAAAQAQREAEAAAAAAAAAAEAAAAQAAAEAAAAAEEAQSSSSSSPVFAGPGTSAGDAQAIARGMLGGYGWGDDQFGCLVSLWDRESGWNSQAYNESSGAFGIPQALPGSKMATAGADWQTNAATQIAWGLGYIANRYGTPCGAWGHSESYGWY
jgi:hypothetical protein